MASILRAGAKEWQAMDMNTVPTDSLRKMFNLAAHARGAGIVENFEEVLHQKVPTSNFDRQCSQTDSPVVYDHDCTCLQACRCLPDGGANAGALSRIKFVLDS